MRAGGHLPPYGGTWDYRTAGPLIPKAMADTRRMCREEMQAEVRMLFARLDRVPAVPVTFGQLAELWVVSDRLVAIARSAADLAAEIEPARP